MSTIRREALAVRNAGWFDGPAVRRLALLVGLVIGALLWLAIMGALIAFCWGFLP